MRDLGVNKTYQFKNGDKVTIASHEQVEKIRKRQDKLAIKLAGLSQTDISTDTSNVEKLLRDPNFAISNELWHKLEEIKKKKLEKEQAQQLTDLHIQHQQQLEEQQDNGLSL